MTLTIMLILAIIAFGFTIASAFGRVPLWIAVVFLCILELLRHMPLGR